MAAKVVPFAVEAVVQQGVLFLLWVVVSLGFVLFLRVLVIVQAESRVVSPLVIVEAKAASLLAVSVVPLLFVVTALLTAVQVEEVAVVRFFAMILMVVEKRRLVCS